MTSGEHTQGFSQDDNDRLFLEMMQGIEFEEVPERDPTEKRELPNDLMDPQIAITSHQMMKLDDEIMFIEATGKLDSVRAEQLIGTLSNTWPYERQPFTYSGRLMVFQGDVERFVPQYVSELELQSRGFVMFKYPTEISPDEFTKHHRMGYLFLTRLDPDAPEHEIQAIIMPEDSIGLVPPFDSSLARAARYKRENPEQAAYFEELLANTERDDQSLMELKDFYVDADPNDTDDARRLTDALAYLNIRADLNKSMMHFLSFGKGDLVQVGAEGEKNKRTLTANYSAPMMLEHLLLLPRGVADGVVDEGVQRHIPYIQVLAYEKGVSRRLVVPLESLLWIQSARYAEPTPPKFSNSQ